MGAYQFDEQSYFFLLAVVNKFSVNDNVRKRLRTGLANWNYFLPFSPFSRDCWCKLTHLTSLEQIALKIDRCCCSVTWHRDIILFNILFYLHILNFMSGKLNSGHPWKYLYVFCKISQENCMLIWKRSQIYTLYVCKYVKGTEQFENLTLTIFIFTQYDPSVEYCLQLHTTGSVFNLDFELAEIFQIFVHSAYYLFMLNSIPLIFCIC